MAGCDLAPSGSWRDWAVLLTNTVAGLLLCSVGAHADVPDALRAYQRGDFEAAAAELMPFAEEGDPRAQFAIGRMCFYGQVLAQDASAATGWYRRAAEQGYAPAQLAYAIALDGGWGVPRDPETAMRWYHLAALQGETDAMWRLAYHYRRGVGAPRNLIEAWAWFDRLAEAGDSRAAVERDWLGLAGLNEDTMAQARVRSAALARELEAAPIMAELEYFWGESHWPGYDPGLAAAQNGDWDRARREWQARAREGDAGAQFRLAELYTDGRGVRRDPLLAQHWLKEAAGRGHVGAQLKLAQLYQSGDGIARDPVEALAWFLVALPGLEPGEERDETRKAIATLRMGMSEDQHRIATARAAQYRTRQP
jgi:TPR repeat protein